MGAGWSRVQQLHIEGIIAGAEVFAVGENQPAAEDAQLGLRAGVEEPPVRAQLGAGIGDFAHVDEGAELQMEQAVAVKILVQLPIFKKVLAAQRSASLCGRRGCRCERAGEDRYRVRGQG